MNVLILFPGESSETRFDGIGVRTQTLALKGILKGEQQHINVELAQESSDKGGIANPKLRLSFGALCSLMLSVFQALY